MNAHGYLQNNYMRLISAVHDEYVAIAEKHRGDVLDMYVDHDDDCPLLLADGRCRCNPVIRLKHMGVTIKRWRYTDVFKEEDNGSQGGS